MTDLFRSALNYLGGGGGGGRTDHELVGTSVEVGGLRLRIKTLIAEGGFALVFSAVDSTNREYALKRLLAADREAADEVLKEIRFLRLLAGHPNIITYVNAASISPQESGHGRAEYLVLTELCTGGPVIDALRDHTLRPDHVIKIFQGACRAVAHMHRQSPPITHRDMKVENLLLDDCGVVKLCDFGSATTESYQPDDSWTATRRSQLEDEMSRHTTPMYRAPEMLDLYLNYPIGPPLDVWALGCILYYLCYRTHPFEDSAKLRIINANYTLPEIETPYTVFHPLIESTLQVDPRQRPTITDLCERTEALAVALSVDLKAPLRDLVPQGRDPRPSPQPQPSTPPQQRAKPPPRPAPPVDRMENQMSQLNSAQPYQPQENLSSAAGGLFGQIKGSAGSIFKNLKDTSQKVVQSVQHSYGGKGPDLTYLTSRLVLSPIPEGLPEAITAPVEETMKQFLDGRHRGKYAVYNLGSRKLRTDFGGRLRDDIHMTSWVSDRNQILQAAWVGRVVVREVPLAPNSALSGRPPTLHCLFLICKNMSQWLRQDAENLCVLTGPDAYCVQVGAAFLVYCHLAQNPLAALELVAARRARQKLSPSMHRYLDYAAKVCGGGGKVHNRALTLQGLKVEPVPLFNRARTGCRPFVEIWVGSDRALSTSQEYERLRPYELPVSNKIEVPLSVTVCGDVTIGFFHARSTLGAKVQGRFAALPIWKVSFHTGFLDPDTESLDFTVGDLDEIDEDLGKYPEPFRVTLAVKVASQDRPFERDPPAYWNFDPKSASPKLVVSDKEERDTIYRQLGLGSPPGGRSGQQEDFSPAKEKKREEGEPSRGAFLSQLDWQTGGSQENGKDAQLISDLEPPEQPRSRDASRSPVSLGGDKSPATGKKFQSPFMETAEAYERMYGIRVSSGPVDPEPEPEPPEPEPVVEGDLLNLGAGLGSTTIGGQKSQQNSGVFDPFAQFESGGPSTAQNQSQTASFADFGNAGNSPGKSSSGADLLQDWTTETLLTGGGGAGTQPLNLSGGLSAPATGMPRNVSAPQFGNLPGVSNGFQRAPQPATPQDPFAGLTAGFGSAAATSQQAATGSQAPRQQWRSQTPTPMSGGWRPQYQGVPQQQAPRMQASGGSTPTFTRPNYSRSAFDATLGTGGVKPKVGENAFSDLLGSQGFSQKSPGSSSMAAMKRKEDIKEMTMEEIKIRDWIKGKERNIRALLGSLHEVVWESCTWHEIPMSQLLNPPQIKKAYRKACLAVHPDKQTGQPHEELAKAIFTELNDAWNDFESAGQPSL